jgi:cysteine desulfurase/selenocysteine lyase
LGSHHSSDVGQILDQENIAIRAGHLCAQPLMRKWSPKGFVRVSLSLYNDSTDIDALVAGLEKAKEILQ